MKILVTGGAGYIGSFMTKALIERGDEVVVFDNLERGNKEVVDKRAELIRGDITNAADLESLFSKNSFDAAIHFAGLISVGESQEKPELYYKNNVEGSRLFFETAVSRGINNLIFSSSAAVYGNPLQIPIPENHPKNPTSEYGKNKLEIEKNLLELKKENPQVSFAALRYFNAAGATLDGSAGENHSPETHLIPNVIISLMKNETFKLFGSDYKTADGTCIRDYIHVLDLVEAHILALEKIRKENGGFFYNVGTGKGYSNREVIGMIESISGQTVNILDTERRAGDADELVANVSRINKELEFSPKYSDLKTIVESAWKWHNKK